MSFESKITRKEFYEKLSRKSGSEATPANAQTALNNFELYCQHEYKKSIEEVIDELIKYEKQDGNQNRALISIDRFCKFLQEEHPDILVTRNPKSKKKPFQVKMPSTIQTYIPYVLRFLRMRGLKISREDIRDFVTMPQIIEEEDPEPFTNEEIRQLCQKANVQRRLFYMVLKDSALRLMEGLSLRKKHINFTKNPVEINLPAKYTKGKKKPRLTFLTIETAPDLKRLVKNLDEDVPIFATNSRMKQAISNEQHYFTRLRQELGKENPSFLERYEHNDRYKKNIHSLRAFCSTQAEDAVSESFAHGLLGHKKYLGQYIRNKKKTIERYKTLEPKLLVFETIKTENVAQEEINNLAEIVKKQAEQMEELNKNQKIIDELIRKSKQPKLLELLKS